MGWFPSLDALGGTNGKRLRAGSQTLAQLKAGTSRLIESFPYDYGSILAASDPNKDGWLSTPLTVPEKANKVIVVGCGMSGLLAARELLRAGLTVEMYDRERLDQSDTDWTRHHYGRACSDIRKFAEGDTVCELGGMRFPVKAKATWQVFSEAFDEEDVFEPFPNPGIVPTVVCEDGLTYPWHVDGSEAPALPAQFTRIAGDVATAMNGLADDNGTTSADVIVLLALETLSAPQEAQLHGYWSYMVRNFDNMTFGAWIHERVAQPNNWTPDDMARFFNLGFGTGGMGSLFPVGFLEMLRIWIWDYADEYALPPGVGLGSVAHTIMTKLKAQYGSTLSVFEQHEVQEIGIFASQDEAIAKPGLLVRNLAAAGDAGYNLMPRHADFMVVAVPHTATVPLLSLTSDRSYPRNNARAAATIEGARCEFHSYFDRPTASAAFNTFIRPQKNAVARLNMVNASKSFYAMRVAPWNASALIAPWRKIDETPVQCVLSEGWSRASYFLEANPGSPSSPCAALLSYTWNLDSTKFRAVFDAAPARENVDADSNAQERPNWFNATPQWWRSYRTFASVMPYALAESAPAGGHVARFFNFYDSESPPNDAPLFGDETGVDWQDMPGAAGGFKLDAAGDFQTSNTLAYAYLLTEESAFSDETARWKTYQRIYLASCSASNYGGWCEGAFMAGANAAIGVLAMINKDKLKPEPSQLLQGNPFADSNRLVPLKLYLIPRNSPAGRATKKTAATAK